MCIIGGLGRHIGRQSTDISDQFLFLGNQPQEKIRPRVVYALSVNCPRLMST